MQKSKSSFFKLFWLLFFILIIHTSSHDAQGTDRFNPGGSTTVQRLEKESTDKPWANYIVTSLEAWREGKTIFAKAIMKTTGNRNVPVAYINLSLEGHDVIQAVSGQVTGLDDIIRVKNPAKNDANIELVEQIS